MQLNSPPPPPSSEDDGDLASFFAPDDHHHGGVSSPMASRHGVLLSHSVVIRRTCCIRMDDEIHYRHLDPITGARDAVAPPPDCACAGTATGYAILTAADLGRRSSGELLLLVGDHLDKARFRQHVHSFSAAARRWGGAPAQVRRRRMVGSRAAAVHRGAAHWLYADDTVDASVPQSRRDLYLLTASPATPAAAAAGVVSASVTKLAIKAAGGVPYLCVSRDGGSRLSLARVHATRVDVWAQQDGDGGGGDVVAWLRARVFGKEWVLERVIQMPAAAAVPAGANLMCCSWFHVSKGTMMAVTEAMEKIVDLSGCAASRGFYRCLPYEMDLPEFFLGRLGGRAAMEEEDQVAGAGLMSGISSLIFQFIMPDASLFMRDYSA
ncbi:unnamed protein product [Urochloa humidicola]